MSSTDLIKKRLADNATDADTFDSLDAPELLDPNEAENVPKHQMSNKKGCFAKLAQAINLDITPDDPQKLP